MEIPLVCYCNVFFTTCPCTSHRSGLFIQTAVHWMDWELLKTSFFHLHSSWIETLFSFIVFLAGHFSSIPQTWRRLKLLWAFFTFFKAGIQISSPGLDKSCVYKHPGISLQPNRYPCKEEGSKSHESNSGFKQISCGICSTLRFVGRFKCCLCLSPLVCSGLPQLFEEFHRIIES